MQSAKPDYGIDAPGVIRNLSLIAVALFFIARFLPILSIGPVTLTLRPAAIWIGVFCALEAVAMLLYSRFGKFHHRDRMLALVNWKGDERVLDVGTGRGLLLIGAAMRLTTGKAIGIDIWSKQDLSANSPQSTLRNIEAEAVSSRVEIRSEDATAMSFPNASFDVVLSNLCIHNIPTREGRDRACREIVRVLKPEGKAIISDFRCTAGYVKSFQLAGAKAWRGRPDFLHTFPPLRIVEVVKPVS